MGLQTLVQRSRARAGLPKCDPYPHGIPKKFNLAPKNGGYPPRMVFYFETVSWQAGSALKKPALNSNETHSFWNFTEGKRNYLLIIETFEKYPEFWCFLITFPMEIPIWGIPPFSHPALASIWWQAKLGDVEKIWKDDVLTTVCTCGDE